MGRFFELLLAAWMLVTGTAAIPEAGLPPVAQPPQVVYPQVAGLQAAGPRVETQAVVAQGVEPREVATVTPAGAAAGLNGEAGKPDDQPWKAYYPHIPYARDDCEACHTAPDGGPGRGPDWSLKLPVNELCLAHHPIKGRSHPLGGAITCLSCHEPHAGPWPKLLKKRKGELCLSCHAFE